VNTHIVPSERQMLTNWRVRYLTTVAAVGGALILGVTAPVRAAVVTLSLENAELTKDDAVTGCDEFDSSENENTHANRIVCSHEKVLDNIKQNIAPRYAGGRFSSPKNPEDTTHPQIINHKRKVRSDQRKIQNHYLGRTSSGDIIHHLHQKPHEDPTQRIINQRRSIPEPPKTPGN